MLADHVLAIDQGTTSTRAILFDRDARVVGLAQRELTQHYPALGWVEHDADEIWRDTLGVCRDALAASGVSAGGVAGIGITNQRETTSLWDRRTGEPVHRAIVWQDRRTADVCAALKEGGAEHEVRAKTGLLLDPYFSATKLTWLLDHIPEVRRRAERGELAFGTIDSFLLWRLTGGKVHATDATNASRTMLFDIRRQQWDPDLCRLFRIPECILPEVHDCSADYGLTAPGLFERQLPIGGMAGDQQAALIGQACFAPGMAKATYGTGCFLLLNTGEQAVTAAEGLLTTTAYRLSGRTTYAVEGSIFVAGAAIKWLRDGLGVIVQAADTDGLAMRVPDSHGVTLVPAFVGLGAPHWNPDARAAIFGLTLDATGAHLARAALESVAFQTSDLFTAMTGSGRTSPAALRIDGGMAANGWLCQFLADIVGCPVERPVNLETTALGAAFLAGMTTGLWSGLDEIAHVWAARDCFRPNMPVERRSELLAAWHDAVRRTIGR
jgi:glycerol kinase